MIAVTVCIGQFNEWMVYTWYLSTFLSLRGEKWPSDPKREGCMRKYCRSSFFMRT